MEPLNRNIFNQTPYLSGYKWRHLYTHLKTLSPFKHLAAASLPTDLNYT